MRYMHEFNASVTHVLIRQMPDVADLFPDFYVVLTPPTTPPASPIRAVNPPTTAAPPTTPLHSIPPQESASRSDNDFGSLDTFE